MSGLPFFLESVASRSHWERVGARPRTGICVPLFSLRSGRDCGVGDTADLMSLVDWCAAIGASVIQVLPVNDMGLDRVPYAALSAFALDPVFIALDRVEAVAQDRELLERYRAECEILDRMRRVDYLRVRARKTAILQEAFRRADSPGLRERLEGFRADNPWLDDYLVYRAIKAHEGYCSWEDWGERYAIDEAIARFRKSHADEIAFLCFQQWILDRQFREVKEYANARGVLLKGDVPILVSRDSADVWRHPYLFRMDTSAGAPPDMYAREGQNWGFPTYDWDAHRASDFAWWRGRLRQAERYFDLYRIDHVVGFFRIWTIPLGEKNGLKGAFVPPDEADWAEHGRSLLKMMLESTSMLPLAEDLGTIPPIAREVLAELGICGLKVQRWEKHYHGDGSFKSPDEYPPLSVATLSTHDSETLAGWWEKAETERAGVWGLLGKPGEPPAILSAQDQQVLLRWIAKTGSLFVILQLQDVLSAFGRLPGPPEDHRVNVPGVVNDTNWTWRSPVRIEDLLADEALCRGIQEATRRT